MGKVSQPNHCRLHASEERGEAFGAGTVKESGILAAPILIDSFNPIGGPRSIPDGRFEVGEFLHRPLIDRDIRKAIHRRLGGLDGT